MILAVAAFMAATWSYWNLHGGRIEGFAFWIDGDKKWLEVLFWSFLTAIVRSLNSVGWDIRSETLQKRDIALAAGLVFEAPIVALALVFIVTNLGLSLGDTTVSLNQVPMLVVIGFSVVFTYFAQDTVATLYHASAWIKEEVKKRLQIEAKGTSAPGVQAGPQPMSEPAKGPAIAPGVQAGPQPMSEPAKGPAIGQ